MSDNISSAPATAAKPYDRRFEIGATVFVLLFGFAFAFVLTVLSIFLAFAYGGCGDGSLCNEGLFFVAWGAAMYLPGAVWLSGLVLSIMRLIRRRRAWPVGAIAAGASLVVWLIAALLIYISVPH